MSVFSFQTTQLIPASKNEVWDFISSPANLKHITPPYMGFDILTKNLADKMYPGMIIQYKVRPLFKIPMHWVTEITQVKELEYFVDEQRSGPYAIWHHQHHLSEVPEGVRMHDIVHYKPPLGLLGNVANFMLIKSTLKEIFDFRHKAIENKFGKIKA